MELESRGEERREEREPGARRSTQATVTVNVTREKRLRVNLNEYDVRGTRSLSGQVSATYADDDVVSTLAAAYCEGHEAG